VREVLRGAGERERTLMAGEDAEVERAPKLTAETFGVDLEPLLAVFRGLADPGILLVEVVAGERNLVVEALEILFPAGEGDLTPFLVGDGDLTLAAGMEDPTRAAGIFDFE